MKNTKLLIFLIALTVVLSVNFAFAADDNATDLAMNADEDIKDNDLTVNEEDLLSVDEFKIKRHINRYLMINMLSLMMIQNYQSKQFRQ
ncbi:hypothetical protein [uncultured Methanobrevibacter sp.]|uniref:hypothetical protein n=1 Tax=uncultured Methanobrevibacter sp. TaxID=253161 RepID=UPI0025EFFC27|nr:hypothetical protein [uncultured Methanobrevibacter sp.]